MLQAWRDLALYKDYELGKLLTKHDEDNYSVEYVGYLYGEEGAIRRISIPYDGDDINFAIVLLKQKIDLLPSQDDELKTYAEYERALMYESYREGIPD